MNKLKIKYDEIPKDYVGEPCMDNFTVFDELCEDDELLGEEDYFYDLAEDEDFLHLHTEDIVQDETLYTKNQIDCVFISTVLDECKRILLEKDLDELICTQYTNGVDSLLGIMYNECFQLHALHKDEQDQKEIESSAKRIINYAAAFIGMSRGWIKP